MLEIRKFISEIGLLLISLFFILPFGWVFTSHFIINSPISIVISIILGIVLFLIVENE